MLPINKSSFTAHEESGNVGLATKWLRILSLGGNDKIRNHLVSKTIYFIFAKWNILQINSLILKALFSSIQMEDKRMVQMWSLGGNDKISNHLVSKIMYFTFVKCNILQINFLILRTLFSSLQMEDKRTIQISNILCWKLSDCHLMTRSAIKWNILQINSLISKALFSSIQMEDKCTIKISNILYWKLSDCGFCH